MADEQNESLQQDQQGAELKGVTPLQKDHTSELKGAAPLPKDHASPLPKDHSSPSELKGAAPLQKDHTSESSVDENVPPAETLQSATVLDGHAIEEVAPVNPDGTGPGNEVGAGAAGNDDQDGVLYTCCRDLWNCLYGEQFGRPYFLMAQAVVTFILVLFCAYEARGVSSADDSYQWEIAGPVFGSCVYVVASVILFGHKQQLKTTYENARTKLANYLCCFKGLRALLVVGMLRVFVHVSDIWLFTIEDILCLSDSLIAVGVLVSSRIEVEPLGKDDMHGALVKKVAVLVCGYVLVILVLCFKYATVPYGNQPEEPAAGARADEIGQAGDRAAVTGTGGTEVDASDNA
ncbi:unnamed protein product [Brassica oleracea var. botrytis]